MTLSDAQKKDAEYVAAQMHTNSVVQVLRLRMERARKKVHDYYLETFDGVPGPRPVRKDSGPIILPAIDRTSCAPKDNFLTDNVYMIAARAPKPQR